MIETAQTGSRCTFHQLDGFTVSNRLKASSCKRAIELHDRGILDHKLENGKDFTAVVWPNIFSTITGENLASHFDTIEEVMQAWMDSPSHRDNLENPKFEKYGLAEYDGYYVLHLSDM